MISGDPTPEEGNAPVRRTSRARKVNPRFAGEDIDESYMKLVGRITASNFSVDKNDVKEKNEEDNLCDDTKLDLVHQPELNHTQSNNCNEVPVPLRLPEEPILLKIKTKIVRKPNKTKFNDGTKILPQIKKTSKIVKCRSSTESELSDTEASQCKRVKLDSLDDDSKFTKYISDEVEIKLAQVFNPLSLTKDNTSVVSNDTDSTNILSENVSQGPSEKKRKLEEIATPDNKDGVSKVNVTPQNKLNVAGKTMKLNILSIKFPADFSKSVASSNKASADKAVALKLVKSPSPKNSKLAVKAASQQSNSTNWFSSDGEDDIPLTKLFNAEKITNNKKLQSKDNQTLSKGKKNISKNSVKKVNCQNDGSSSINDDIPLNKLLNIKNGSKKMITKVKKTKKLQGDKSKSKVKNIFNPLKKKFKSDSKLKSVDKLKKDLLKHTEIGSSSQSEEGSDSSCTKMKKPKKFKMKFAGLQKSIEKQLTNIVVSVGDKGGNYACVAVDEKILTPKVSNTVSKPDSVTPNSDSKYTILKEGSFPGINHSLVVENFKDSNNSEKSKKKLKMRFSEKDIQTRREESSSPKISNKTDTSTFRKSKELSENSHETSLNSSKDKSLVGDIKKTEFKVKTEDSKKKDKYKLELEDDRLKSELVGDSKKKEKYRNESDGDLKKKRIGEPGLESQKSERSLSDFAEDVRKNDKLKTEQSVSISDLSITSNSCTTTPVKAIKKEVSVFEDVLNQPDLCIAKAKKDEKQYKKEKLVSKLDKKDKNKESRDRKSLDATVKKELVNLKENSHSPSTKERSRKLSDVDSPTIKQEGNSPLTKDKKAKFDAVILFNEKEYRKQKKEEKLKMQLKKEKRNQLEKCSPLKEVKMEMKSSKDDKSDTSFSKSRNNKEKTSKHKSSSSPAIKQEKEATKHKHRDKSKEKRKEDRKSRDKHSKTSSSNSEKSNYDSSNSVVKKESSFSKEGSVSAHSPAKVVVKPEIVVDEVYIRSKGFKEDLSVKSESLIDVSPSKIESLLDDKKSDSSLPSKSELKDELINLVHNKDHTSSTNKSSIYELVDNNSDSYPSATTSSHRSYETSYESIKPYSYESLDFSSSSLNQIQEPVLENPIARATDVPEKESYSLVKPKVENIADESNITMEPLSVTENVSLDGNTNNGSNNHKISIDDVEKNALPKDSDFKVEICPTSLPKDGSDKETKNIEIAESKPVPTDDTNCSDVDMIVDDDANLSKSAGEIEKVTAPIPQFDFNYSVPLHSIHLPDEEPPTHFSHAVERRSKFDKVSPKEFPPIINNSLDSEMHQEFSNVVSEAGETSSREITRKVQEDIFSSTMEEQKKSSTKDVDETNPKVSSSEPTPEEIELKNKKIVEQRLKSFKLLDENLYLVEKVKNKRSKEVRRMVCDCFLTKEELANGDMGCGEDCLNKLLMIECGSRCPLNDRCMNKNFHHRNYADVEVFNANEKGCGIRAKSDIVAGTFLIEYIGEVFNTKEFKRRRKDYAKDSNAHFYFMALRADRLIDATRKGNISRFINHSCNPNAETQKWTVNGDVRIGFFATKNIEAGDEINFDYRLERYGREPQKCYCGTAECRGWLGESPDEKTKEEKEQDRKKELRDKKKREERLSIFEEDDLEDEIEKLSVKGLRTKQDTLNLSRLMVRASDSDARVRLLQLLCCAEKTCRSLFLDYHGLKLLWSWMVDISSSSRCLPLKLKILHVLKILPLTNKTQLIDSRVLSLVERWSKRASEEVLKAPDSPLISTNKKSSDSDSDSETSKEPGGPSPTDTVSPDDNSLDSGETPMDTIKSEAVAVEAKGDEMQGNENENSWRTLETLTAELLSTWSELKEAFRIPKKERIELRKEHERVLDLEYQASLQKEATSRTQAFYDRWRYGVDKDKKDRHRERRKERKLRERELRKELDDEGLSKEERRERFALQVAKEDEEAKQKKLQEEVWRIHLERCALLGQDPNHTPIFDASGHYYWDPSTGGWQSYLGPQSTLPVPASYIADSSSMSMEQMVGGFFTQGGLINEEQMTPPGQITIKLPKHWRMARDLEGHLYFYHTRTRFTQWEIPVEDLHQKLMMQFGLDSDSETDSDISSSSDSEEFSDDEEFETEEPLETTVQTSDGGDEKMIKRAKGKKKRSSKLVQERVISPILFEDREAARRERKEAKERARMEARKERRSHMKSKMEQDSPNEEDEELFEASLLKHSRKSPKTPAVKSKSKTRANTAMADNSETAKRIKESFRSRMAIFIVSVLNPFRKSDCKKGRISTNEDFKYLARKLTHHVMVKELKLLPSIEGLECSESVKHKTKEFVRKYMSKYGKTFTRDPKDTKEY